MLSKSSFMYNMEIWFLIIVFAFVSDLCTTQRSYNCALPDYCEDVITIDPRIQTPDSMATTGASTTGCPNGYITCTKVKCGYAKVSPGASNGQATRDAFPWNVFLQNANDANTASRGYIGGGVLIDQYFVLTAAHKIYYSNVTKANALFGIYTRSDTESVVVSAVQSIYYHSNFNTSTLKDDIALLRLATPVNIGPYSNFICLPAAGTSYLPTTSGSQTCVVVGFGNTNFTTNNTPYDYLKQAYVPIVNTAVCKTAFDGLGLNTNLYLDQQNEICAGGQANVDSCTGDGGSGLFCRDASTSRFNLAGLVTWGKGCGVMNLYGVYVNVPSYINWITSVRSCILSSANCAVCAGALLKYC